jgi:hypothetical protein
MLSTVTSEVDVIETVAAREFSAQLNLKVGRANHEFHKKRNSTSSM